MSLANLDPNLKPGLLGTNPDTGVVENVGVDRTTMSLNTNLRVWDPDTLTWVKMTQPVQDSPANTEYNDIRFEYDASGNVKYVGKHALLDAATSDEEWFVTYYQYDSGNVVKISSQVTSWDDREDNWS